jgi:hypothetical protein
VFRNKHSKCGVNESPFGVDPLNTDLAFFFFFRTCPLHSLLFRTFFLFVCLFSLSELCGLKKKIHSQLKSDYAHP